MKVCFPVGANEGLASRVFGHFGSAPFFVIVDSETLEFRALAGGDPHAGGGCNPLALIATQQVDACVVGGIGGGAWAGLQNAGIKVFRSDAVSVMENLALLAVNKLEAWGAGHSCGGHHHHHEGGGCSHHDEHHGHGGHGGHHGHGHGGGCGCGNH